MLNVLEQNLRDVWDQRHWELALLSKEPIPAYNEMKAKLRELEQTPQIEELSKAEQDWLRKT